MEHVIILQNSSKLNEKQFVKYFEKKVFYTIRKFHFFENIKERPQVAELLKLKKIKKTIISKQCLDDIAVLILKAMMEKQGTERLKQFLPKYKNTIKPFYLMSKEEMNLYGKIKKIRVKFIHQDVSNRFSSFKNKNQKSKNSITHTSIDSELSSFLDELEKNQKNVKNSIVSALLKINHLP